MNEAAAYEGYKKKLEGICDENDLIYQLSVKGYPITLTIKPVQGMEEQMTLLAIADEKPFNNPDATIMFIMEDGVLTYKMSERFTIGDALFGKIKNLFKKLHFCYLMMFHRDVTEKGLLRAPYEPSLPEASNEKLGEPLEEFEDEDAEETSDTETPDFPEELLEEPDGEESTEMTHAEWLLSSATAYVRETGKCVLADLQRKYTIGYAEAARLIEALEDAGVVGEPAPGGGRVVLPFDAEGKDDD